MDEKGQSGQLVFPWQRRMALINILISLVAFEIALFEIAARTP